MNLRARTAPACGLARADVLAVVGAGCRFAGGVTGLAGLWDMVTGGRDAVGGFPGDRGWDVPAGEFARRGGFLDDMAGFDAGFFGISPREAMGMDPQQRVLLEVCWEALEDAGIVPGSLRGSQAGVFVGASCSGYAGMPGNTLTGTSGAVISGRVSYVLGLGGPALTVDTATSSSLVAVHLAGQSLRAGECDLALAGGVAVMATPALFAEFARLGGLAQDGVCRPFAEGAAGTVWGEGAGVVVLERLPDARRNGHRVLAVISGSAVNQDGASGGLTVPDGPAQQRVIRAALASAGLSPDQVDVIEGHGTGTRVGDPVEAAAVIAAYGPGRPADRPVLLGSVKSNIGHAQAAAGVAGLIKMIAAVDRGIVPATLHVDAPSTRVDWAAGAVRLVTEPVSWPETGRPRRAGVSSFGLGGTNAHVIVEQAPREAGDVRSDGGAGLSADGPAAWLVSGRSAAALAAQAARLREFAAARPDVGLADVAWSLATARQSFEHRAVVIGRSREELAAGLAAVAAGEPAPGVITGLAADPGPVVFVFPGQGTQWPGMGRDLAASCPVFAAELARCSRALAPFTGWDLEDVLADDVLPDRADVVQPALWAVMVSLSAAWQAAGVIPDAVVGHSQGEIAAATVAGILSLDDGARVVALRSQALAALSGRGAMASVAEPAEAVRDRIAAWGERLAVAAVNGPAATVVSGEPQALDELMAACELAGVRARRVPVDYASHGPQVDALREEILAALAGITPGPARIPMISAMTGRWLEGPDADARYWYDSLRSPVEFGRAVAALADAGHGAFVEASPHPVLIPAIAGPAVTGTLRRGDGGPDRFLASLAGLHVAGGTVDWAAVLPGGQRVRLPAYAFQHQPFWVPPPARAPGPALPPFPAPIPARLPADAAGVTGAGELFRQLAGRSAAGRDAFLLDLVLAHVAVVLGHASRELIDPRRTLRDLGIDSVTAVELPRRLNAATGLRLPDTVIFGCSTPAALAARLHAELLGDRPAPPAAPSPRAAMAAEPVAVVGIGCRFPGGVRDPEGLWELLAAGVDAISEFPADRGWDTDALYDPDPDHPGTSYTRRGGFVADVAGFDAGLFGISPREALAMDPQQRVLLEVCWEAVERAGIDPGSLRGSATGVFAGATSSGYGACLPEELEGHRLTGTAASVVSGRVAYVLGLEGPALTVDTACSSSLVALHLAAQSLRAGECDLALAGGVTVMVTPRTFTEFSRQRGLAPDGRCKSFSAAADGTGWAEGAGVLVLERLADARRNGHDVLAVVAGSAVNSDGASNGLTAPSGRSQQRVIQAALAAAGLGANQVDAVEGHGTGTRLGDPVEVQALIATYGRDRDAGRPLWLGSVKSSIGHAQWAAGVAGVIKMVLALRHGLLPRTLHADQPSPHVDWSAGDVRLLAEAVPWPGGDRPRRAGVSAFGISGTNAHVVLEQAPPAVAPVTAVPEAPAVLRAGPVAWVVSGQTAGALAAQAGRLAQWAAGHPGPAPADVAWSLASTRAALEHRAVVIGRDRDELTAGLAALAAGDLAAGTVTGVVPAAGPGRVVFVFPGQGGQWAGMGRDLARACPAFAARLAECSRALAPFTGWDLEHVLAQDTLPDRADVVQPALWAVMVCLAAAWQAAGVTPAAVAGHSQGEIAAAVVAGILSLDDAAKVVARRSQALAALSGRGGMASLAEPASRVRQRIARWGERLAVAAENGPAATVVSGEPGALAELMAACAAAGVRTRTVPVDYASHGPQVEEIRAEVLTALAGVTPGPAAVPMVSAVTGEWLDGPEADAGYWYESLRAPVEFSRAVRVLAASGHGVFVEVSPHPVLTAAITETAEQAADGGPGPAVTGTLRRDDGGADRFLAALAAVYVRGVPVGWEAVRPAGRRVELPVYAFQHRRFWLADGPGSSGAAGLGQSAVGHPLLGAAVELPASGGLVLTGRLSLAAQPWLADHAAGGQALVAGAALAEMAVRAGHEAGCGLVAELLIDEPVVLPARGAVLIRVAVEAPGDQGRRRLVIHSRPARAAADAPWTRHAAGVLAAGERPGPGQDAALAPWPPPGAVAVDLAEVYPVLAEQGYELGPVFRGVRAAWRRGAEIFAEVALPEGTAVAGFGVHPGLLEAAWQVPAAVAADREPGLLAPLAWGGLAVQATGASVIRVRAVPRADGPGWSLTVADEAGNLVASAESVLLRSLPGGEPGPAAGAAAVRDSLFRLVWRPVPPAVPGEPGPGLRAVDAAGLPATRVLELVQEFLAREPLATTRLVLVTRGAVAAVPGEDVTDLDGSSVWGLIRSARAENPGRFSLIDLPAGADGELATALASAEPELAVRGGRLLAPRLVLADGVRHHPEPRAGGTVLVTGGLGGLGGLVAEHLAATGRARGLVLASRSGPAAPGTAVLAARLAGAGAAVQVAACDAADRTALAGLLAWIGAAAPLTGVVHAAGVLDDAVTASLTPGRMDRVMRPKAAAAWHLHELTAGLDLDLFVLFSSVAGLWGNPGQGSYAAASAFLDGLAARRRSLGRPGLSLAWGPWLRPDGMTGRLDQADWERLARLGLRPLSDDAGLALLDTALAADEPLLVAARLDLSGALPGDQLPPLLSGLLPPARSARFARPAAGGGAGLAARLRTLPAREQDEAVRQVVLAQAALALGRARLDAADAGRPFRELGFDSLIAVEFRNRLNALTGLRLPAAVVFDYPTPGALAGLVRAALLGQTAAAAAATAHPAAAPGDDRVAIVGMGCRLPGGVGGAGELWDLVAAGRDAVGEFPGDRGWDLGALYDPDPDRRGTSYTRRGGFVADVAGFDAGFFGISPREALAMDPQQRVLLEVCWEALEDAGIDPATLRGTPVGVFAGASSSGYAAGLEEDEGSEGYLLTGDLTAVISGRVSYLLGLEGPAVTVDTACSSSLVALHLAGQALRAGECDLALAGGVKVMITPSVFVEFSRQRGLAPDGRCKAFAEGADGTGWAEGAGVVVVERLADARRNGHRVLAVIAGSAVNQDGASNGLTAPNGPSQQRVIRAALAAAGLTADQVDVVEAHGTGTRLGDPIEAGALIATYGQGRGADRPVLLGSVKSNIGHAQAAAGIAGVIKMVVALDRGVVPATLHVDAPSSRVDWSAGAVRLVTGQVPWPRTGRPRRAAVSSFGISGTNAHVILEQPPSVAGEDHPAAADGPAAPAGPVAWPVSGRSAEGLAAQAERLARWVTTRPELDPADLAWSLARTRSAFEHRAVVIGRDREELAAGLAAVAAGEPAPGARGVAGSAGKVAFVFTGQGAQRAGMGRGLAAAFPVFAAAFDAVCAGLDEHLGGSVAAVIDGADGARGPAALDDTIWAQAGLFAVEVALFRLLESWGVRPDVVAGHSIGELAAAHVAGVWSLADACAVVAARGRLMQQLPPGGAMAAAAAAEEQVRQVLAGYPGVVVAAVNGPRAVVISGVADAVTQVAEELARTGVRTRRLRVSHAFHSPLMEPMLAGFAAVTAAVAYQPPRLPLVSALTGAPAGQELTDPGFWVRHVREPVRFADAVTALRAAGVRTFVEVGPGGALTALGLQAPGEAWLPVLRRDGDEPRTLAEAVAGVHVRGGPADWAAVLGGGRRVDLPSYAFRRQRFWPGARTRPADAAGLGQTPVGHPLLGAAVELPGPGGLVLTGRLSLAAQPWLAGHVVAGRVLVPGAALAEMAIRAGAGTGCGRVEELVIELPLVIPDRGAVRIRVTVAAADETGRRQVAVYAQPEETAPDRPWTRHAAGALTPEAAPAGRADTGLAAWPPAGSTAVDLAGFYPALAAAGLAYGPSFRGVRAAWRRDEEIFAEVALAEGTSAAGFGLHPALLDAALQVCTLMTEHDVTGQLLLPFAWSDVAVHAGGATAARVRIAPSPAGRGVSVLLTDSAGMPVATAGSVVLRALPGGELAAADGTQVARDALFRVDWVPADPGAPAAAAGRCAVLGPDGGLDVPGAARYRDLAALAAAVAAGDPAPRIAVACCLPLPDGMAGLTGLTGPAGPAGLAERALRLTQEWLAAPGLEVSRLVVVTRRAVDAGPGTPVELAGTPVWGLLRTASSEHPGRLVLADADELSGRGALVLAGAGLGEREFAVRGGELRVPRLAAAGRGLAVPDGPGWRLTVTRPGTVENLVLAPRQDEMAPLEPGQVRVAVRAAGVNFRDVLNVLGMYPGEPGSLGLEGAGVVLETTPEAAGVAPGDVVMGLFPGSSGTSSFGPVAVTDGRLVAPVPPGWSLAQAAGVPVAFLTAYYALVDLAGLHGGESVLIHAAAGGVGMAAVQLARQLGARVFGTASPGKWPAVRALGLDDAHLASSRTTGFEDAFLAVTGGRGVDVVLDSLAGEFVDASLRLTAAGGRFIEMGKTDIRDPRMVADAHRVAYQAFDLLDAGPDRIAAMLGVLGGLFAGGDLAPLPVTCWDMRRAPEAFRYLSQARHTGKVVLTIPAPARPGTVLVTGGTGGLGGLVSGHLAATGQARGLLMASRSGPAAPGAAVLAARVAGAGAAVQVAECDAADRPGLAGLLARVPADAPLTGVMHAAGVLDDAVTGALSPARLERVMRPKADGAWHLHELTAGLDLDMFVLFSAAAGIWGNPGQAGYAAANTFLDGLAAWRRGTGLPGVSLAWGPWLRPAGMTGRLGRADWERMARLGLAPLSDGEGLVLLDAALAAGEALLVPARLDLSGPGGPGDEVPPLLSGLVRPARSARPVPAAPDSGAGLAARLAALPPPEQDEAVRQVVLSQAALVLGLAGPEAADTGRSFRDLGFDSLTAVELRNRLSHVTGLRLAATVVFDYPAPEGLATYLRAEIAGARSEETTVLAAFSGLERLESSLDMLLGDEAARARVAMRLKAILSALNAAGDSGSGPLADRIQSASDDDIFDFIDNQLGV